MNLKQALQRIEELERKVAELQARPQQNIQYHYHQPAPQYYPVVPTPYVQPFNPHWPQVTLGGSANMGAQWPAAQAQ